MGHLASDIRNLGAEPIAVAVTATFSQRAFAASLGIEVPLLSDWSRDVSRAYGVAYDMWKGHDGLAKRSVFVIDRHGIVRYRWVTDDAMQLPDLDEPLAVLRQLA